MLGSGNNRASSWVAVGSRFARVVSLQMRMLLPPTSERLHDPATIPYFLWDIRMSVADARAALRGPDVALRRDVIVRLLREANTRDVWLFTDWRTIESEWPHVQHRLGRARPVWEMMLDHRRRAVERAG